MAVIDLNGDHKLDLATVNNFADNVTVFAGTGAGTFASPTVYVVGDRPSWVAAGDLNGDGLPDLAVVNTNSHTVTLLETPLTAAAHFRMRIVPTTTTAGITFQVTVTALDADNRLMTGYAGSVSFTSSDGAALLPAVYRFTAADQGVHRLTITLHTAGSQSITAHAGAATGSASIDVVAAAANHLQVAAATATAGTPFDVTVTARDPFGNLATSFHGTVHFATTDHATGIALPGDYTFTAGDNGSHTFAQEVTLVTAGVRTIMVTDPPVTGPNGSTPVAVHAAAASQLFISAPTSVTAGTPFSATVTAKDPYNNIATGFTGTVHFASSGNSALPADYTFVPGDLGIHKFTSPILQTAGPQSLTVSAPACSDGVQNGINVKPGAAAQLAILGQPTNAFAATPLHPAVTVQVEDAYSNLVAAGVG
ncbi:MAG TPA: VCBS repeat-containing protein, partial [Mycobacteriales bacterium]|nr:VCBS repeat-containing protein [Mycobacteriales bacterium]